MSRPFRNDIIRPCRSFVLLLPAQRSIKHENRIESRSIFPQVERGFGCPAAWRPMPCFVSDLLPESKILPVWRDRKTGGGRQGHQVPCGPEKHSTILFILSCFAILLPLGSIYIFIRIVSSIYFFPLIERSTVLKSVTYREKLIAHNHLPGLFICLLDRARAKMWGYLFYTQSYKCCCNFSLFCFFHKQNC